MTYFDRTEAEREIIRLAYEFEVSAIETIRAARTFDEMDERPNPYLTAIMAMADGEAVWEALNEAVEMVYH